MYLGERREKNKHFLKLITDTDDCVNPLVLMHALKALQIYLDVIAC